MQLLQLPRELLAQVLYNLTDVRDLVSLSSTCHTARLFCSEDNSLLWQCIYLRNYDDPRQTPLFVPEAGLGICQTWEDDKCWYQELKKRYSVLRKLRYIEYRNEELNDDEAGAMIDVILDMVDTAKAAPTSVEVGKGAKPRVDDRCLSLNLTHLPQHPPSDEFDSFIRGLPIRPYSVGAHMPGGWESSTASGPVTRSRATMSSDKTVRSDAAYRLHVLCGISPQEQNDEKYLAKARRVVYDWDTTNANNDYGLYKPDGSGEIDWRRLDATMTVASRQFCMAVRARMNIPIGLCFSIPNRILLDEKLPEDWARCTGQWSGTYVFLHWEDLVEYNLSRDAPHRPTLDNGPEACGGLMKMELKLDMRLAGDKRLHTDLPVHEDERYPPLYFSGLSRSYDYQMTTGVRGMVCLIKGGREVRWRYIIQ